VFIDVPGHERFVRNMLAGAAGIDLALLVISALESVKPQTWEHFEVCRMLGVKARVIAITKAELADPEVRESLRFDADEHAPRVRTGSHVSGRPLGDGDERILFQQPVVIPTPSRFDRAVTVRERRSKTSATGC
jgi:hypothetical protein